MSGRQSERHGTRGSDSERLRRMWPALECRSRVLAAVRQFFLDRDFIEVETPVRVRAPALEPHIDAEPSGDVYLRTSPELHMKRLLAAGYPRVFQMGPCFRRGERGPLHRPEYTMLEWYRAEADGDAILADTMALVPYVAKAASGVTRTTVNGVDVELGGEWRQLTVSEAFTRFAGWDPVEAYDADRFDLDLVERVEPALPRDVPVILRDYPAGAAALARVRDTDPPVAERWELYIAGMELANAYTELTDPEEQRRRFESCARFRRESGRDVYPADEAFLESLSGMPPAGGIALGVDRLVLLLYGGTDLEEILPFSD